MPEEKSSEIRRRIRKKIEEELAKRGLELTLPKEFENLLYGEEKGSENSFDSGENIISSSAELDVESLAASDRVVNTSGENYRGERDEDYWSLGKPKPRSYEKPSFSPKSLSLEGVEQTHDEPDGGREQRRGGEKIPDKAADGYVSQNMNPFTTPHDLQRHVATGTYRNRRVKSSSHSPKNDARPARVRRDDVTYEPGGVLIHRITVKDWSSDTDFYSRFASDAALSHNARSAIPPDAPANPVSFYSFVPQYSHMTNSQLQFYRWLRENIRLGRYPNCDSAYIMLYIYEIINLDGVIEPDKGASLLVAVWMGYRKRFLRLDGYMCEWLADYCMINKVPMPREIVPLLSELVPKAQFKEFYLDALIGDDKNVSDAERMRLAASALIENSSDYDYTSSRYYPENREAYEKYIPLAMAEVLRGEFEAKRGIFSLDRNYRMTRDSYMGAVVSSAVKKRLDIEFSSFTRRAESRAHITAIVKYSENKLRRTLGIKAKLGVGELEAEDIALLDAFFAPMMPEKASKARRNPEDKYMPEDYLKNYEAESSGFDFSAAAEIERLSWENTQRLTSADGAREEVEEEAATAECEAVEGEISSDSVDACVFTEVENELPAAGEHKDSEEKIEHVSSVEGLKPAVQAALDGGFRKWARENGYYEGELQDRVNSLFLDIIGDVILEDFTLIEDYREDVEEWMK